MTFNNLTPVRIALRTDAGLEVNGELPTRHLHLPERLINGAKFLGLFWLIGLFCVLIPVMHFFLVPLAAIAGIVMFFVKFSQREVRQSGSIKCPKCGQVITLKGGTFNWPLTDSCPNCRYGFVVTSKSL